MSIPPLTCYVVYYFREEVLRSVVLVGVLVRSLVNIRGQRLRYSWQVAGGRAGDQHRSGVAGGWRRFASYERFILYIFMYFLHFRTTLCVQSTSVGLADRYANEVTELQSSAVGRSVGIKCEVEQWTPGRSTTES